MVSADHRNLPHLRKLLVSLRFEPFDLVFTEDIVPSKSPAMLFQICFCHGRDPSNFVNDWINVRASPSRGHFTNILACFQFHYIDGGLGGAAFRFDESLKT